MNVIIIILMKCLIYCEFCKCYCYECNDQNIFILRFQFNVNSNETRRSYAFPEVSQSSEDWIVATVLRDLTNPS